MKLVMADRWDRLWPVFAWAYYWLNVAGWDGEVSPFIGGLTRRKPAQCLMAFRSVDLNPRWTLVACDVSATSAFHPTHPPDWDRSTSHVSPRLTYSVTAIVAHPRWQALACQKRLLQLRIWKKLRISQGGKAGRLKSGRREEVTC